MFVKKYESATVEKKKTKFFAKPNTTTAAAVKPQLVPCFALG